MKETTHENFSVFNGIGYLIGFILAFAMAITVFIISEEFVLALAVLLPLTLSLSISLEKKVKQSAPAIKEKVQKALVSLFALGIVTFIAALIIFHFV